MGGKLEVESAAGSQSGTVIKFKIRTRVSLQPQRSVTKFDAVIKAKNVLLVDDNFTSRNILKRQLEAWNLTPVVVSSTKEALEIAANSQHFDLVITDLDMPASNGITLAESMRKISSKTSFILLNTTGDERYKQYPGLFKAILTKPVKQHLLHKHIECELSKITTVETGTQLQKPKAIADISKEFPLRILIAEDNKTNQAVALKVLEKLGYKAELAENGEEALEMVSERNYDIIFMDVHMPGKDGLEATRMIRLCLSTQPVIIAMTANAIPGDRKECLDAGMDDYISKPFKIEELTKMIEKWGLQVRQK